MMRVSVVIPFFNNADTLGLCLSALAAQNVPRESYEVITVDDGSTDGGHAVAERMNVRVVRQKNQGAPAARNTGIAASTGEWVAFTDGDCVPSRGWLRALLSAVQSGDDVVGAAGPVIGLPSESSASRFVDLSAGLSAERHLSHPLFPFAPTSNVMYRRNALSAVDGFDTRYASYDSCDLNMRIRSIVGGRLVFASSAVVMHKHRQSWKGYWKQQVNYGRGLAQFYRQWSDRIHWSLGREIVAWGSLVPRAAVSVIPADPNVALVRRGTFIKDLAQRIGFAGTYFSSSDRARWTRQ